MTKTDAENAAGKLFDGLGDGYEYPTTLPAGFPHDYVGVSGSTGPEIVRCVGASDSSTPTQQVSTPEGFALGDSVQKLQAIYGSRLRYVAAPPQGMTTNAGYVVDEPGGALAFAVYQGRVHLIAGGDRTTDPNSCTG